jgi:malonyl-CoA/methylmalonyl-CoA synthetase
VAMAVVAVVGEDLDPDTLRSWGKERLAPAKVPTRFLVVADLPRNAMGKVTKAAVRDLFGP